MLDKLYQQSGLPQNIFFKTHSHTDNRSLADDGSLALIGLPTVGTISKIPYKEGH